VKLGFSALLVERERREIPIPPEQQRQQQQHQQKCVRVVSSHRKCS